MGARQIALPTRPDALNCERRDGMTPAEKLALVEPESAPLDGAADFLSGGGEMGALIRSFDWASTPIGAPHQWSAALRTMVRVLLANRFPMLLWWGPDYVSIYNDAYSPILGRKHPWGLGRPVRECWSEIWDVLKPLIDTPFRGGPATWIEDIELQLHRSDFTEETHFTVAYSPVPDDAPGTIGGVLATVHEITEKVIGERRGAILRDSVRAARRLAPKWKPASTRPRFSPGTRKKFPLRSYTSWMQKASKPGSLLRRDLKKLPGSAFP